MQIESYENEVEETYKRIKVYKNSIKESHHYVTILVSRESQLDQVKKQIEAKMCSRKTINQLRLFTIEGVEVSVEDLKFLKSVTALYASFNGEEFDQTIGYYQYEIVKQLGQGGFGKVLLGQHKTTNHKVAIKIVNTAIIGNAEDIDMVFREAEMLKSLVHENIVKIYNFYTLPNMEVVFIMEYLEGGELLDLVQSHGRLSENLAREIFIQVAEAIQYCHHQNLIHRDLKLENILLAEKNKNTVKIVDFGIAGLASNMNVAKIDAGSLKYMAPELFNTKLKKIGPHIDIWALGVILYGMVFGTLPFDGETSQDILHSILQNNYSFPNDVPISIELKNLLQSIFHPNHHKRIKIADILYVYFTILIFKKHKWCLGYQTESKNKLQEIKVAKKTGILSAGKSRLTNLNSGMSKMNNKIAVQRNTLFIPYSSSQKDHSQNQPILELAELNRKLKQKFISRTPKIKRTCKRAIIQSIKIVPQEFRFLVEEIKAKERLSERIQTTNSPLVIKDEQIFKIDEDVHNLQEQSPVRPKNTSKISVFQKDFIDETPLIQTKKSPLNLITKDYGKVVEKIKKDPKFTQFSLHTLKKTLKDSFALIFPDYDKRGFIQSSANFKSKKDKKKLSLNNLNSEGEDLGSNVMHESLYLSDDNLRKAKSPKFPKLNTTTTQKNQISKSSRIEEIRLRNNVRIGFYQKANLRIKLKKMTSESQNNQNIFANL